ncbi:MAG TPA: Ig-like domain-containing protein [Usitatibacter sp.]|nr:Ig-like domain-containing protein [Usitatibacter sp.]
MRLRLSALFLGALVAVGGASVAPLAQAAAGMQLLTPRNISVAGGESQLVSVRVVDSAGRPAAGETVRFSNDACGYFQNGQFSASIVANADGVATVRFTASIPPGITCWIQVGAAPAQATVDVLTYSVNGVRLVATTSPEHPKPGEPYTLHVKPSYGMYAIHEADVTAAVVPGSGSATLSRGTANTGQQGSADFDVRPAGTGEYLIQLGFRTQAAKVAMGGPERTWQDMWWAGSTENGWGISIVQHRDTLFAVIYAYDEAGKPTWFVIPGGTWNAAKDEFTGLAYVPTGSPFYAYDPSKLLVGPAVGSVRISFTGPDRAFMNYSLNGRAGYKDLERNYFGAPDFTVPAGLGDMWWGGAAQDGWGVAVLQQYRTLFIVWFTFDANGAPTWYVMPGGQWTDAETYGGRIYRATSSPWLGTRYDPSRFATADVGSFRLKLTAGGGAVLDYTLEGRSGSIPLVRYAF